MTEILSTVSIISYLAAGIFAVVAVTLWFIFQIPSVIRELSGGNTRELVKRMREDNKKIANRSLSSANTKRKKITKKTEQQKSKIKNEKIYETGLLSENKEHKHQSQETALLVHEDAAGTAMMEGIVTSPLDEGDATQILNGSEQKAKRRKASVKLKLIEEIIFLHTDEVV